MSSEVRTLDAIESRIAQVEDISDGLELRPQMAALERWARGRVEISRRVATGWLRLDRRLGDLLSETVRRGGPRSRGVTLPKGVSKMQSSRWQALARVELGLFEAYIRESPKPTYNGALRYALTRGVASASTEEGICTSEDLTDVAAAGLRFGTVYADPPWQYGNQGTRAATGNHYVTMGVEEIATLPVGEVAAENAHLHLWTTNAFLFDARTIIEAWGFTYKSCLVWVKPQMGIGNYWRVSHEFLLLGVRGSCPFLDKSQQSWLHAKRSAHSRKPREARERIELVSPGPRLELFGRAVVPGWVVWGNEIERTWFERDVKEYAA